MARTLPQDLQIRLITAIDGGLVVARRPIALVSARRARSVGGNLPLSMARRSQSRAEETGIPAGSMRMAASSERWWPSGMI